MKRRVHYMTLSFRGDTEVTYMDNRRHHMPHIHVTYQGQEAVLSIPEGELLEGEIRANKMKLIQAWIEIHKDELMAN